VTRYKARQNFLALGHFPRKKKAAVPVRARSCPLALSGLQKNGSRWPVPTCAFAPHASGMLASDREDSRLYLTIFIPWGAELVCMTLLVKSRARERQRGEWRNFPSVTARFSLPSCGQENVARAPNDPVSPKAPCRPCQHPVECKYRAIFVGSDTAGDVSAGYAAGASAISCANGVMQGFARAVSRNHSPSRSTFSSTAVRICPRWTRVGRCSGCTADVRPVPS
jgi:hypothetical protein